MQWTQYQPVEPRLLGYYGVVRDDSPPNFIGTFDGRPGRVCIGRDGQLWVSVLWEPDTVFPVRAWAPAAALKTTRRRY